MGVQSFLYGYIGEAWPGMRTNGSQDQEQRLRDNAQAIKQHNDAILAALPETDEWPPLNRHMFACAPGDAPMINYKMRPIHFAASLKEVDWELRDWLDKFEDLLRRMYWEKAVVHFHAAYLGEHDFVWRASRGWMKRLTDGILEPIDEWEFESSMERRELERLRDDSTPPIPSP